MDTSDELDGLIGSAAGVGIPYREGPGRCPDPSSFAQFIDGVLGPGETEAIQEHLCRCGACLDIFVLAGGGAAGLDLRAPSTLRDRAAEIVRARKSGALEIIIRIADGLMELVSSSGTMLGAPAPAFARGGAHAQPGILRTSKAFEGMEAEAEVEMVGPGEAAISVFSRRPGGGAYAGLRASLFRGPRELCSIFMEEGRAVFERVAPGRYAIVISEAGKTLGEINIDMIV